MKTNKCQQCCPVFPPELRLLVLQHSDNSLENFRKPVQGKPQGILGCQAMWYNNVKHKEKIRDIRVGEIHSLAHPKREKNRRHYYTPNMTSLVLITHCWGGVIVRLYAVAVDHLATSLSHYWSTEKPLLFVSIDLQTKFIALYGGFQNYFCFNLQFN